MRRQKHINQEYNYQPNIILHNKAMATSKTKLESGSFNMACTELASKIQIPETYISEKCQRETCD
jgi:hypothetical protein